MTLDRRVPYAFHLLMDRDAIIDAVYLGKGNPSTIQHLNWYHGWAIDQETTRTLPGYRPNKRRRHSHGSRVAERGRR